MQLLQVFALGIAFVGNTALATIDLGQIENGGGKALTNSMFFPPSHLLL
jgi:hypothetical protein